MKNPLEVKITPERVAAQTVEQKLYHVPHFEKLQFTLWALEEYGPKKCLLFVNTKRTGEWLAFKLWHNGWEAGYISGDVAQKKRLKLVEQFKSGELELLVGADSAHPKRTGVEGADATSFRHLVRCLAGRAVLPHRTARLDEGAYVVPFQVAESCGGGASRRAKGGLGIAARGFTRGSDTHVFVPPRGGGDQTQGGE